MAKAKLYAVSGTIEIVGDVSIYEIAKHLDAQAEVWEGDAIVRLDVTDQIDLIDEWEEDE